MCPLKMHCLLHLWSKAGCEVISQIFRALRIVGFQFNIEQRGSQMRTSDILCMICSICRACSGCQPEILSQVRYYHCWYKYTFDRCASCGSDLTLISFIAAFVMKFVRGGVVSNALHRQMYLGKGSALGVSCCFLSVKLWCRFVLFALLEAPEPYPRSCSCAASSQRVGLLCRYVCKASRPRDEHRVLACSLHQP